MSPGIPQSQPGDMARLFHIVLCCVHRAKTFSCFYKAFELSSTYSKKSAQWDCSKGMGGLVGRTGDASTLAAFQSNVPQARCCKGRAPVPSKV